MNEQYYLCTYEFDQCIMDMLSESSYAVFEAITKRAKCVLDNLVYGLVYIPEEVHSYSQLLDSYTTNRFFSSKILDPPILNRQTAYCQRSKYPEQTCKNN